MARGPRKTRLAVPLAALGGACVVAASALAGVTVYKNDFAHKRDARELRPVTGGHCDKKWRKKSEVLRVTVKTGPEACGYRPPVEGDSPKPDHDFRATGRVLKDTPKALRDHAYVSISVRTNKKTGYELQVFPGRSKFELIRRPRGGGKDFPVKGRKSAIKGIGKSNALRLAAIGDKITAKVNGKRVARVTDSKPSEVKGSKLEVSVGNTKSSHRPVLATIDDLKLLVPKG